MRERLETDLIEAAASGDIESFGKLCDRYYSVMVAISYSILGDHQLAEDAAQEAFARALAEGGSPPIPYEHLTGVSLSSIAAVESLRSRTPVKVEPLSRS